MTGGLSALGAWAWYWSWLTALVWFPLMVIAYIIRAPYIYHMVTIFGARAGFRL